MPRITSGITIDISLAVGLLLACGLVLVRAPAAAAGEPGAAPDSLNSPQTTPPRGQELERRVPFDSAGRVLTITPGFARRFQLGAPWAVSGDFVEARLYERSAGGFVLVVERARGALERTLLESAERDALARVIDDSIRTAGGVTTGAERADLISEPAGRAFARSQTLAAALVWGPALAALTDQASTGSGVYLATVGATFFITTSMARGGTITRAQTHLASDGAYRGAGLGSVLLYAAGGDDPSGDARAVALLGGSLATTTLGFMAGRGMTDGEAHGATWGSTFAATLTAGVIGAAGGWEPAEPRGQAAVVVGAAVAGYPLGLRWVRHAGYGVTEGDVTALHAAALIGLTAGAALIGEEDHGQVVSGVLTAGFLAGSLVGDRAFARPFNLTGSQGRQLSLGALAGGLIGMVPPVLAESDNGRIYFGAAALGAAAGMALTRSMLGLDRVGKDERAAAPEAPRGAVSPPPPRLRLLPQNLAWLLARRPGCVPVARVEF